MRTYHRFKDCIEKFQIIDGTNGIFCSLEFVLCKYAIVHGYLIHFIDYCILHMIFGVECFVPSAEAFLKMFIHEVEPLVAMLFENEKYSLNVIFDVSRLGIYI